MLQSPVTLSSPNLDIKKTPLLPHINTNTEKSISPQLPSNYILQQQKTESKGKDKKQWETKESSLSNDENNGKEMTLVIDEKNHAYLAPTSPLPSSCPSPLLLTRQPLGSTMSLQSMGSEQLLDHSHLKPGDKASLLSYKETINMYRVNAKKTNDMEIQCDFAIFLVEAAKRLVSDEEMTNDHHQTDSHSYIMEAEKLLKQIATRGHSPSQYYLGNMYASGLLHKNNKFEFERAFPFYVQAAKHHHPDAAYRTAKCYEDGLGTKKDKGKAVQYYRKAAALNHPGAMYRMGLAQMKGELGLSVNVRDGHKWLKRSAEASTFEYPHALHELAQLHERGAGSVVFTDHDYAVRLYQEASDLGYAPSCFRLGECYEFGRLGCTVDPRLSMHYYGLAAEQGHPHACFALTAWYLVGCPDIMEPSEQQAFMWALKAAEMGLPKAEYAVGYFYEVGIGIEKNEANAYYYYQKAAGHDEKRAIQRLQTFTLSSHLDDVSLPDNATPLFKKKKSFIQLQKRNSTPSLLNNDLPLPSTNNYHHHDNVSSSQLDLSIPHQHRQSIQSSLNTSKPVKSSWLKKWKNKLKN
ncbi:unnamed protein product [Cunninghamella blakesleeana]